MSSLERVRNLGQRKLSEIDQGDAKALSILRCGARTAFNPKSDVKVLLLRSTSTYSLNMEHFYW